MRKTVRSRKVMNMIAVGIAAMIAVTSVPATVFAEEATPSNTETTTVAQVEKMAGESEELIETAATAVDAVEDGAPQTADGQPADDAAGPIETLLNTAEDEVKAAETAVGTFDTANQEAQGKITEANNKVTAADNAMTNAEAQVDAAVAALAPENETITENADSSIDQAKTANTSNNPEAAYAAQANAVQALGAADAELKAVVADYVAAGEEVTRIQGELAAAEELYTKAEGKLTDATTALGTAKDDAKKAADDMAEAQKQMDALNQQASDLKYMQEQYYNVLVWYFRNRGAAVYNADGTLNVEDSAANIDPSKVDELAKNIGAGNTKDLIPSARYVSYLLTKYMLEQNGAEDVTVVGPEVVTDNINEKMASSIKVDDTRKEAKYGKLDHVDRTFVYADVEKQNLNKDDFTVIPVKWNTTGKNDGRENYAVVTFTKDGEEQSMKINYVLKSNKEDYKDSDRTKEDGDEEAGLHLEEGFFYLAQIVEEDGKLVAKRVDDKNNFSDYQKLCEAVKGLKDLDDYQKAKKAVDDATQKVADLEAEINKLKAVTVDRSALNALQGRLTAAQGKLDAAKELKETLEAKVEEARAAVNSIDLSRFAVVVVPADDDTDDAPAADEPTVIIEDEAVPGAGTIPGQAEAVDAQGGAQPAVLGANRRPAVRVAANKEQGGVTVEAEQDGETLAAEIDENGEGEIVIADADGNKKAVKIEDEAVALAGSVPTTPDGHNVWWWWILLLILVIAYIIKKTRDEHNKKVEAAKAQNNGTSLH